MYARIQSWFPFNIQIGMNGREWLARQMDRRRLRYCKHDNCIAWVKDYERAQCLLDEQLKSNWAEILDGIARRLNPRHEEIFSTYAAEYYWSCYQSEWATDVVFPDGDYLKQLMPKLVRHGMLSYSSPDVMRYLGRKLTAAGTVPKSFSGALEADMKRREEGERVKFRMNWNSLKFYDKLYLEGRGVLKLLDQTMCSQHAQLAANGGRPTFCFAIRLSRCRIQFRLQIAVAQTVEQKLTTVDSGEHLVVLAPGS